MLYEVITACGVPSDQVHIKVGETEDVIIDIAQKLDAYMVVRITSYNVCYTKLLRICHDPGGNPQMAQLSGFSGSSNK